jgi:hypothetical protein
VKSLPLSLGGQGLVLQLQLTGDGQLQFCEGRPLNAYGTACCMQQAFAATTVPALVGAAHGMCRSLQLTGLWLAPLVCTVCTSLRASITVVRCSSDVRGVMLFRLGVATGERPLVMVMVMAMIVVPQSSRPVPAPPYLTHSSDTGWGHPVLEGPPRLPPRAQRRRISMRLCVASSHEGARPMRTEGTASLGFGPPSPPPSSSSLFQERQ